MIRAYINEVVQMFVALGRIKRNTKNNPLKKPIKVVFICQYIPAWIKVKPVYDIMLNDERFEPILLCVPGNIKNNELVIEDGCIFKNDTYEYFSEHGYKNPINALLSVDTSSHDVTWFDLKTINPDYVFHPRPYNVFMPKPYTTSSLSAYTRICMVMYGICSTIEVTKGAMNRDFFRDMYCYFAETPFARDWSIRLNFLGHKLGIQKTYFSGMPALEEVANRRSTEGNTWGFAPNESYKLYWTPRWITDLSAGGSNFFTYKDFLLDFAKEHKDFAFQFRPHPLAIAHFIETGEMTREEADDYNERCNNLNNVQIDALPEYINNFWASDAMISDISSIIPEYFMTGKPVIFCASNMVLTLAGHAKRMFEGCYIVYNQEELEQVMLQLKRGEDPLKEERLKIIDEVFGGVDNCPGKKIVEALYRDCD